MSSPNTIKADFAALVADAYALSQDVGEEVERLLEAGRADPLSDSEASALLICVISVMRENAICRGDAITVSVLQADAQTFVDRVVSARRGEFQPLWQVPLVERNGIKAGPIFPKPMFHGMEVAMNGGFLKTTDIKLWGENLRLDIHLSQFRQKSGREPTSEELLEIMLSKMDLPGVSKEDEFAIVELARSIAINGVRKPPIVDINGALLDGNRRVAACYYILNSTDDEFDSSAKRRAEYIYVWQLSEHTTDDQRNAVVVSLNFEPDLKQPWPEYIKARKVFDEWEAMVLLEPRQPGPQRQAQMKRELSLKYALGPDTSTVNRYLKMVEWAIDFEEHHVNQKGRDEFEVKHRANRYFQYFDEMAKGTKSGGVAHAMSQDDSFKHLVFDLLFDGKFQNWRQIRELKYIYDSEEAREALIRARHEEDPEIAEDHLENAMAIARSQRAEMREVGANTRIEAFVKWLEELPVKAWRDAIKSENLRRLLRALKLVEQHTTAILQAGDADE